MTMQDTVRRCLPPRAADTHKGSFGTVLSVCGSYGMAGAAVLAGTAAYRCGAGKVMAVLPHSVYPTVAQRLPEAVFVPCRRAAAAVRRPACRAATAVLVGCGLGQGRGALAAVRAVLGGTPSDRMLIVDADGINCLARHIDKLEEPFVRRNSEERCILTPHPLELARLLALEPAERDRLLGRDTACDAAEREQLRVRLAGEAARRFRCVTVLKGHRTVVADPHGQVYSNESGNAGMAVAGSGDVLAGMLAGLAAAGSLTAWDTAVCGVYLHGLAGDAAAARVSQRALLPTDMLEELGKVFLTIEQQE